MAVTALDDEIHRIVSSALDTTFYRGVYPELDRPGFDPVRHYLAQGWREGRDPAPWFSARGYLLANPDIVAAGREPFSHYLTVGRLEGRETPPSAHAAAWYARGGSETPAAWRFVPRPADGSEPEHAPLGPPELTSTERRAVAEAFDRDYYLASHPDIADAGADALTHFLEVGWREGRNPAAWFSTRDYLQTYPDVAARGVNPFLHYLMEGQDEGRSPRTPLGFRFELLATAKPVARRMAEAQTACDGVRLSDAADLAEGLASARTGLRDLHLTFSHDDYLANAGGVQLCVQREGARVTALGRDHLHLNPSLAWPMLRAGETAPLDVILNGRRLGAFAAADVVSALKAAAGAAPAGRRSFAFHSLLGHGVEEVLQVLGALGLKAGYFWLHDFASLCAGYHLMRDDVEDCGAPPPDSAACTICAYGPWRARHLSAHERLFHELELTVVSPSEVTLDFWRRSWGFPTAGEVVLPHARLVERGPAPPSPEQPFRLAFIGGPAAHKGWPAFRDLAFRFAADRRYQFLQLGSRPVPGMDLVFEPVVVSEQDPRAMQAAMQRLEIDAVLLWPLCRETFSFTAYEAIAAGAAVVTNPDSGNVAAVVEAGGHGVVLADEAALAEAFESGTITRLARSRRKPQLYDLAFSDMTADLLPEAGA